MNEARCPYCGAVIEFDDEFTNFDDQGDCITASAPTSAIVVKA